MKSSLSTYKTYLKKNLIKFDPNQESAITVIDKFLLDKFSIKQKIYQKLLKRGKSKNGIYLYGEAGVGKTMLMDICFSSITIKNCLLYTSPSPRDGLLSRMPSSA